PSLVAGPGGVQLEAVHRGLKLLPHWVPGSRLQKNRGTPECKFVLRVTGDAELLQFRPSGYAHDPRWPQGIVAGNQIVTFFPLADTTKKNLESYRTVVSEAVERLSRHLQVLWSAGVGSMAYDVWQMERAEAAARAQEKARAQEQLDDVLAE